MRNLRSPNFCWPSALSITLLLPSEPKDTLIQDFINSSICVRRHWHPTPVLLPRNSHGRRSLVGCSPWGRWGSDMTELSLFTFMHWRRKGQPTRVFFPGESQGWRSLVGCYLWGSTEHDWSDLAAVAAVYVCVLNHFSCVQLFATLWTEALQTPLSMRLSRQEYWNELPCPPSGDLLDSGIKPRSPALQADSLPSEPSGKPRYYITFVK